jgi:hypothetical protein
MIPDSHFNLMGCRQWLMSEIPHFQGASEARQNAWESAWLIIMLFIL